MFAGGDGGSGPVSPGTLRWGTTNAESAPAVHQRGGMALIGLAKRREYRVHRRIYPEPPSDIIKRVYLTDPA